MSATAQTPETSRKRKLTVREAAEQWIEVSNAIDGLKPLQKQAADVLLANAQKTGRRTYFDRIAVQGTGGNLILDKDAVMAALPASRFVEGDLLKRQRAGLTLKLLKRG